MGETRAPIAADDGSLKIWLDEEGRAALLELHRYGACRDGPVEAFFPEKGGSARDAYARCAECSVRIECLAFALEHYEREGVWGMTNEIARRPLLRRMAAGESPLEIAADHASQNPGLSRRGRPQFGQPQDIEEALARVEATNEETLTAVAVARLLDVGPSTIHTWVKRRRFPEPIGKQPVRFRRDDVLDYLRKYNDPPSLKAVGGVASGPHNQMPPAPISPAGGLASTYIGGTDMTEPTPNAASSSTCPPWLNLHAVVDEELCSELDAVATDTEALQPLVQELAIRAFRAGAAFEVAVAKALEGYEDVSDGLYAMARRFSGQGRLEEAVATLVANLEVTSGEPPSRRGYWPDWLDEEKKRAGVSWPETLEQANTKLLAAVKDSEDLVATGG